MEKQKQEVPEVYITKKIPIEKEVVDFLNVKKRQYGYRQLTPFIRSILNKFKEDCEKKELENKIL